MAIIRISSTKRSQILSILFLSVPAVGLLEASLALHVISQVSLLYILCALVSELLLWRQQLTYSNGVHKDSTQPAVATDECRASVRSGVPVPAC